MTIRFICARFITDKLIHVSVHCSNEYMFGLTGIVQQDVIGVEIGLKKIRADQLYYRKDFFF